jgi:thiol-disulfide isomerase/thioredoxin
MSHRKNRGKTDKTGHPFVVGLIYADWCGHCQHLKPEWEKMKQSLLNNSKFKHGKIIEIEDSDLEKETKLKSIDENLTVEGFPTIVKKENGSPVEVFQGDRTSPALLQWVLSHQRGGFQYSRRSTTKRSKSKKSKSNRKMHK